MTDDEALQKAVTLLNDVRAEAARRERATIIGLARGFAHHLRTIAESLPLGAIVHHGGPAVVAGILGFADALESRAPMPTQAAANIPRRPEPKQAWGHAVSNSPEVWTGTFDSREECIDDGQSTYGDDKPFWIVQGTFADPARYVDDASDIVDRMNENAASNDYGFYDDDVFDVSKETKDELNAFLAAWASKLPLSLCWLADGEPECIHPNVVEDAAAHRQAT